MLNFSVTILDIPFAPLAQQEVLKKIEEHLLEAKNSKEPKPLFIATPNPEMLLEAQKNHDFKKILQHTDLNIADGIGILWASIYQASLSAHSSTRERWLKWIGTLFSILFSPKKLTRIIPERVTGTDLLQQLCKYIGKNNSLQYTTFFFLGAQAGIAEKTAGILHETARITIAGAHEGSARPEDDKTMQEIINKAKPDILFVAFGAPKQELWLARNLPHLKSVKVAMGVGGAFDFIAGVRKRAPRWMQRLGIEWLYRVIQEPRRIKRIFNATVRFSLRILFSLKEKM